MEAVFTDILNNNKETIFRICKAYADNSEDAEDYFQEVLLNIWRSLPSFQNRSSVNTWVYRITLNVCTRAKYKTDKRKNTIRFDSIQFDTGVENTEDKNYEALYDCIRQLNDSDKSLMLLFLEDLSYKEIAAVTGLTENHVAVKIKRIKMKLFTCLKLKEND